MSSSWRVDFEVIGSIKFLGLQLELNYAPSSYDLTTRTYAVLAFLKMCCWNMLLISLWLLWLHSSNICISWKIWAGPIRWWRIFKSFLGCIETNGCHLNLNIKHLVDDSCVLGSKQDIYVFVQSLISLSVSWLDWFLLLQHSFPYVYCIMSILQYELHEFQLIYFWHIN